jgi:hypothetical protein
MDCAEFSKRYHVMEGSHWEAVQCWVLSQPDCWSEVESFRNVDNTRIAFDSFMMGMTDKRGRLELRVYWASFES